MKTNPRVYESLLRLLIGPAVLAVAISSALAQINGSDPSLRFWFKADTLSGTDVPVWNDSSSHGIVMAVPPLPPSDPLNDLTNHTPQLITVTNNNKVFPAVFFRQAYDPINPAPNPWHFADRLFQQNKLDENDPTLIYPTNDMTMIIVWLNYANEIWIGPGQAIVTKRGTSGTDYQFGFSGETITPYAFNGSAFYAATSLVAPKGEANREWGIHIMNLTTTNAVWYDYFASRYGWRTQTTPYSPGTPQVGTPLVIATYAGGPSAYYERSAGYFAEIAMYNRTLSPSELAAIQQELLTKYFVNAGPPVVVAQPQSLTVNQYESASFAVNVDGTPPFTYQWLKDSAAVTKGTGANGPVYTIPIVAPSDQDFYSVAITNSAGYTNSDAVYLTVIPDNTAPTITSVLLNATDPMQVKVTFSELVDPATATNAAFYSINNAVTINSIVAVPQTSNTNWPNHVFSVLLNTTGVAIDSKLSVSGGVQDRGGTPILATVKDIFVPVVVGTPPTENLVMWLKADTGVMTDPLGVVYWADQSGGFRDAGTPFGYPQLAVADFPNAQHPVVTFAGSDRIGILANPADFNLQNLTIYLVGAVDTNRTCKWVGNYRGFALGNGSGNGALASWNTVSTAGDLAMTGGSLQDMVPVYVQATFSAPNKTLSVNGALVGSVTNAGTMDYSTDNRGMCLGALYADGTTHGLVGHVAEVLFYSDVSPSRDAAMQTYIATKYFTPSVSTPKLVSAAVSTAQNTNVTAMFSLPPSVASAGNAANYIINNGATVSAVTVLNSTTVLLTTSPLNPGLTYTLTATNVADWTGVAPSSQVAIALPGDVVRLQDSSSDYVLVLEAEHYSQNTPSAGQAWTLITTNSPWLLPSSTDKTMSGTGGMMVLPDNNISYSFNTPPATPTGIPQLDYKVWFTKAGTNYVWVRGSGNSDTGRSSDSINLGLDGVLLYRIDGQWSQSAGYAWGRTPSPAAASFRVPTAGYHVINLWMREDGFFFDKLVLSSNPTFNPSGLGPAESKGVLLPVTVTRGAGGDLTLAWSGGGTLQSAVSAGGPYGDIPGATSPYPVNPAGKEKYYRLRQ